MDYHRHDRRGSDRVKGEKDTELPQIKDRLGRIESDVHDIVKEVNR